MKEGFLGELHFLINLASLDKKSVAADLRNYLSLTVDICSSFEPIRVLSHHFDEPPKVVLMCDCEYQLFENRGAKCFFSLASPFRCCCSALLDAFVGGIDCSLMDFVFAFVAPADVSLSICLTSLFPSASFF